MYEKKKTFFEGKTNVIAWAFTSIKSRCGIDRDDELLNKFFKKLTYSFDWAWEVWSM